MSSWQMLCTKEGHVSMYVAYPLHVSRNFLLILSHPYLWIFDRDPGAPHSHNNNKQTNNTHSVSIFHAMIHHHPNIPHPTRFHLPFGYSSWDGGFATRFSSRLKIHFFFRTFGGHHMFAHVAFFFAGRNGVFRGHEFARTKPEWHDKTTIDRKKIKLESTEKNE
jgi:hypothetical protein